jgi:copper chaperone
MTLSLTVPNLACSACVETVTQAIHAVDATAQVAADPKTKAVTVATEASKADIKQAIAAAGYTVV